MSHIVTTLSKINRSKNFLISVILIISILNLLTAYSQMETVRYTNGMKYSSNALNAIFNVLEYHNGTEIAQLEKKKTSSNAVKQVDNDTTQKNSISIRESNDRDKFLICLKLDDYSQYIQINIYNMLGKMVLPIYSGPVAKPQYPDDCQGKNDPHYQIDKSRLSNGFYLCVVHGEKFRLVDKFIVSR